MSGCVLVPLDGSARARGALPVASVLAEGLGCAVHLLRAAEAGERPDALRAALAAEAEAAGLSAERLHTPTTATAAEAIQQVAASLEHPVICMTTRGQGDVRAALLGSVSASVLAGTDGPLVLLGPRAAAHPPATLSRLLVALDGSLTSEAILPTAMLWAELLALPVTLLHVGERVDAPRGQHDPHSVVAGVADQYRTKGLALDATVRNGEDPAEVIAACADEQPGTLLAMASHGRSGVRRMLLGSVTADTVRQAASPVLTVRPAGLVDPGDDPR